MIILLYIAIALIGAALGIGILGAVQKATGRSRARTIVEDAQREAEVIMKDKLLEAREQELRIKSDAEKAANQRLSRVQSEEAKIKQRQAQLNQQQSENKPAMRLTRPAVSLKPRDRHSKQEVKSWSVCASRLRRHLNTSRDSQARRQRRSL